MNSSNPLNIAFASFTIVYHCYVKIRCSEALFDCSYLASTGGANIRMPDITGVVAFNVTRLTAILWDTTVVLPNLSYKVDMINALVKMEIYNAL